MTDVRTKLNLDGNKYLEHITNEDLESIIESNEVVFMENIILSTILSLSIFASPNSTKTDIHNMTMIISNQIDKYFDITNVYKYMSVMWLILYNRTRGVGLSIAILNDWLFSNKNFINLYKHQTEMLRYQKLTRAPSRENLIPPEESEYNNAQNMLIDEAKVIKRILNLGDLIRDDAFIIYSMHNIDSEYYWNIDQLKAYLSNEYGLLYPDKLETIGDKILDVVIMVICLDQIRRKVNINTSEMIMIRRLLCRNTTQFCFMNSHELCSGRGSVKDCANQFEMLLGSIWCNSNYPKRDYPKGDYLKGDNFRRPEIFDNIIPWLERSVYSTYIRELFDTGVLRSCNNDRSIQKEDAQEDAIYASTNYSRERLSATIGKVNRAMISLEHEKEDILDIDEMDSVFNGNFRDTEREIIFFEKMRELGFDMEYDGEQKLFKIYIRGDLLFSIRIAWDDRYVVLKMLEYVVYDALLETNYPTRLPHQYRDNLILLYRDLLERGVAGKDILDGYRIKVNDDSMYVNDVLFGSLDGGNKMEILKRYLHKAFETIHRITGR